MNESLSITNLEAERQRRQIAHFAQLARMGAALPEPTFGFRMTNPEGGYTTISVGPATIVILTELGGDWRTKVRIVVSNLEVEEEILKIFPDEMVAKKLFDHIFEGWEINLKERNGEDNFIFQRCGDSKFSARS